MGSEKFLSSDWLLNRPECTCRLSRLSIYYVSGVSSSIYGPQSVQDTDPYNEAEETRM